MFVEDQKKKILFNMLYYKITRENSKLIVFDMEDNPLGILAEYDSAEIAKIVIEEVVEVLKFCEMNNIFCVYNFPLETEMEKVIESGQK